MLDWQSLQRCGAFIGDDALGESAGALTIEKVTLPDSGRRLSAADGGLTVVV